MNEQTLSKEIQMAKTHTKKHSISLATRKHKSKWHWDSTSPHQIGNHQTIINAGEDVGAERKEPSYAVGGK
jgi:hypothetical protein